MTTRPKKLLFCSYSSYVDHTSGAALATRDLLELLAGKGWECAALTGPFLDDSTSLEDALRKENIRFQFRPGAVAGVPCTLYHAAINGVAFHGFAPTNQGQQDAEYAAFLDLFNTVLTRSRPDIVLLYGSIKIMPRIIQMAKESGAKTVFALHNAEYNHTADIAATDGVFVPSEATRKHYETKFGIKSTAIAGPWNRNRFLCDEVKGEYVTFVNPQLAKGAFWVARIAYEMQQLRPDIPFLIVDGRAKSEGLARSSLDLRGLTNLRRMFNTSDPRQFYRVSKMLLVPSLWQEAHARVAVEAIINGIPVLASRKGGLPEVLQGAGFLFDIPERYTPQSPETPTAEEVRPWVETIVRLWDDNAFFEQERSRCREVSKIWHSDVVYQKFGSFFTGVLNG